MSAIVGGLTSAEAAKRLLANGPNEIGALKSSRLRTLAAKFWAPVPWLLELTVVLELVLKNYLQASVFALLLVFNAVLSTSQEGRGQEAVELLRARLKVTARVARDGEWTQVPASDLVVGDLVHVRLGDFVPADLIFSDGHVELDQSALTGESRSTGAGAGDPGFSGSVVVKGEASGVVGAIAEATSYGRTAELVSTVQAPGNMERLVLGVVRDVMGFSLLIVAMVIVDAMVRRTPFHQLVPFVLILVIASVPVALPATFTLATALGSKEMARRRVLVTRLAAIEEAASMEVLCIDKTGTLTKNQLAVSSLRAEESFDEAYLLRAGAAASSAATQDPLDLAILAMASARQLEPLGAVVSFSPFDPATKRSESVVTAKSGQLRVMKGAPQVVGDLAGVDVEALRRHVDALAADGSRVLGVAQGSPGFALEMVGLIAMSDPPREDAAKLVEDFRGLGIQVVMLTGDGLATAAAIAARVGIGDRVARADVLRVKESDQRRLDVDGTLRPWEREDWKDVYAEVLPEDKMRLIASLQRASIVVGMTGDGVNDAPALRRAEVGVAVSSATDVAKAAASLVLVDPGLENMVAAIEVSRRIHQRMLTYTLNKVIKTLQVAILLGAGFVATGHFVTTPTLVVLLLLANDFPTMSLATDHVRASRRPQRWRVRSLLLASLSLAVPLVLFSLALWSYESRALHLDLAQMQTVVFVWLVTSGQATVYLVREREHFWHARPSIWLGVSSAAVVAAVLLLSGTGVLMARVGPVPLVVVLGTAVAYLLLVDLLKGAIFRFTRLAR